MGIFSRKIVSNSLWMMLEKFIGIFGVIFVNSYMAKYVGAENFGKIIFAASIFLFVQSIAWFGSQNVYLKRMSENRVSGLKLAIANLNFRRLIFAISSIILLIYLYFFTDIVVFVFGLASCIVSYYSISDILSIYNNSQLKSIINAITNIIGLVVALILRYILVYYECNIYYMTIPIVLIVVIPYSLRWLLAKKQLIIKDGFIAKNNRRYNTYLWNTGGALLLSSLSIVIYNQISNIFLAKFSSFSELGIYNVAMTLGGAWAFVNVAIITSIFSKIYAEKSKDNSEYFIVLTHYVVIFNSLMVGGILSFLGPWLIKILYGSAYVEAGKILVFIVFATALSNIGVINYRYMMKLGAYKYLSIKMLFVSLLSIPCSFFLIKEYGVWGAVYCFILVEFISLTLANYIFNKGEIFKLHLKLLNPFYFLSKIKAMK